MKDRRFKPVLISLQGDKGRAFRLRGRGRELARQFSNIPAKWRAMRSIVKYHDGSYIQIRDRGSYFDVSLFAAGVSIAQVVPSGFIFKVSTNRSGGTFPDGTYVYIEYDEERSTWVAADVATLTDKFPNGPVYGLLNWYNENETISWGEKALSQFDQPNQYLAHIESTSEFKDVYSQGYVIATAPSDYVMGSFVKNGRLGIVTWNSSKVIKLYSKVFVPGDPEATSNVTDYTLHGSVSYTDVNHPYIPSEAASPLRINQSGTEGVFNILLYGNTAAGKFNTPGSTILLDLGTGDNFNISLTSQTDKPYTPFTFNQDFTQDLMQDYQIDTRVYTTLFGDNTDGSRVVGTVSDSTGKLYTSPNLPQESERYWDSPVLASDLRHRDYIVEKSDVTDLGSGIYQVDYVLEYWNNGILTRTDTSTITTPGVYLPAGYVTSAVKLSFRSSDNLSVYGQLMSRYSDIQSDRQGNSIFQLSQVGAPVSTKFRRDISFLKGPNGDDTDWLIAEIELDDNIGLFETDDITTYKSLTQIGVV